jgi:hypothetical protein
MLEIRGVTRVPMAEAEKQLAGSQVEVGNHKCRNDGRECPASSCRRGISPTAPKGPEQSTSAKDAT